MRIAFIVPEFPSLSQTFVLDQMTGLIDLGHQVDIFASVRGHLSRIHENVQTYKLLPRTRYYADSNLNIPKNRALRIAKGLSLAAKASTINPAAVFNALNIIRYGRQALSFRNLFRLVPFLDKGHYDILHCHFGPCGVDAVFLKKLGALHGKIVTTFHGYDLTQYLRHAGPRAYDSLFETGDLFLPISTRWKEKLLTMGCREDKIRVHRMGIDVDGFKPPSRSKRTDGKIKLLSVARLVEKKGIEYAIRAVSRVAEHTPNLQYRIAGDGPLKEDLVHLAANLGLEEKVHFLGSKEHNEILHLMSDSDILLAPSVTSKDGDQEGIPVVLMEALAMQLPVISTDHSGIPELVQDGVSGLLVPERDVETLAKRLTDLIEQPKLRISLGRAGRKAVEQHYNIIRLNGQLAGLFKELLGED